MRKRRKKRLWTGLLCVALLMTDIMSMGLQVQASEVKEQDSMVQATEDDQQEMQDGNTGNVDAADEEESGEETAEKEEGNGAEEAEPGSAGETSGEGGEEAVDPDGGTGDADGTDKEEGTEGGETDMGGEDSAPVEEESGMEGTEPGSTEDTEKEDEVKDGGTDTGDADEAQEEESVEGAEPSVSENDLQAKVMDAQTSSLPNLPDDVVRWGRDGDILWMIDKNGKMTWEGHGNFAWNTGRSAAPWASFEDIEIKTIEVNITGMTNARRLFLFEDHANYSNSDLESVDLSGFDTSQVTDMSRMFYKCIRLKNVDLSGFDMGNVTDMSDMFKECGNLETVDLSSSETGQVTSMSDMFCNCNSLKTIDLSGFDTGNVSNMSLVFYGCNSLKTIDLSGFDTRNVSNMSWMFYGCTSLETIDLSSFNTENVVDMSWMFMYCNSLETIDVSGFDTGNVTLMNHMFLMGEDNKLRDINLGAINTAKVVQFNSMFRNCDKLTSLDVSSFDTGNGKEFTCMFMDCSSLESLDVTHFDTGNALRLGGMFANCSGLKSLDVTHFDTRNVSNVNGMFSGCNGLTELDLSGFYLGDIYFQSENYENFLSIYTGDKESFTLYTPVCFPYSDCLLPGYGKEGYMEVPGHPGEKYTEERVYRDSNGNPYQYLQANLDESVCLVLGKKTSGNSERIAATKGKTAYLCGDVPAVDDLTVRYYSSAGTVRHLAAGEFTTNVSELDMTTPGYKTLTVSYTGSGGTHLTSDIILTVSCGLKNDCVRLELPEEKCVYDGKPQTPAPKVFYNAAGTASGNGTEAELQEGRDYRISYKNNVNAFSIDNGSDEEKAPTIIITEVGTYNGIVEKAFTIEKALSQPEEMNVFVGGCQVERTDRTLDLTGAFAGYGRKIQYTVWDVDAEGLETVLIKRPSAAEDIRDGILTYGTKAVAAGSRVTITIRIDFENYQGANLTVNIMMVEKNSASITGITMKNTVYNAAAAAYSGTAVVMTEDGEDISGQVTLIYRYSGTQADGTPYPETVSGFAAEEGGSADAPVNAGDYIMTVSVADTDEKYVGKAVYPFTIGRAPLTVTARDVTLAKKEQIPTSYEWDVEGLVGMDTLLNEPSFVFADEGGNRLQQSELSTEAERAYEIIPYGADAGMNYQIAYCNGTLAVMDERVGYSVAFDSAGHGSAPAPVTGVKAGSLIAEPVEPVDEQGAYLFEGWYKDRSYATGKKWNFTTDTVQSDMTLYACWIRKAAEGAAKGTKICIQEIQGQTYTGSAVRPNVTVYSGDGKTLLKAGKDYTIKYANNINAVAVGIDGKPKKTGGVAAVTDPGKKKEKTVSVEGTFTKDMPYIILTGKGNYKETLYKNFVILPADISDEDDGTPVSGFTLKYTEQMVKNANKAQQPFKSLKYKKNLQLGKDFTVTLQAAENVSVNGTPAAAWSETTKWNAKSRKYVAPAIPKGYSGTFTMIITGAGCYQGSVERTIYVAESADKLMMKAKITLGRKMKELPYQRDTETTLTPGYFDTAAKKYYALIDGRWTESGKDDLFLVSFGSGKNAVYLRYDAASAANSPYSISYRNNRAAGTATMTIIGNPDKGYVGSKSVTFKIRGHIFDDKEIRVKCDSADESSLQAVMPYTGRAVTQNKVVLTAEGTDGQPETLVYGRHYTISYKNHVKKGKATIIFTAIPASGYSGSFKKTFQITPQSLRHATFDKAEVEVTGENADKDTKTVVWRGKAPIYTPVGAAPDICMKDQSGNVLRQGVDYTVSYKDNKAAATDTAAKKPCMTIKGKGSYTGTLQVAFSIDAADIGAAVAEGSLAVSCAPVQQRGTMKFKDFKFKVTAGKKGLKEGIDYTLDMSQCTDEIIRAYADALTTSTEPVTAAEPVVIVKGQGNYTGETAVPLGRWIYVTGLTAKNLKVEVTGDRTYNGANVEPEVKVSYYPNNDAGKPGAKADPDFNESDYSVTYGSNQFGGKKGTVTVTGRGRYGRSVTVKFTIERKAVTSR